MTADQMMRDEIAKRARPPRRRIVLAAAALGIALLVVVVVVGIRALNDYRADIESMQTAAEAYYDAAEHQNELAAQAADEAADSARLAREAASAAEAAEQAAAADQAARDAATAAESAADAPRTNLPSGSVPPNIPGTDQPDSTACASSALVWDGSKSVCA